MTTYCENIIVELYFLYVLDTHVKFCFNTARFVIVDFFFFFSWVEFKVIASCQLNLIFASVYHNLYYFCEEL